MKNKKGFTLIELLAVIVILAIIALISTPIILNMIENAKKGAAKDSAYGYIEAIDFQNSMSGIDSEKYKMVGPGENLDVTGLDVKVKGSKPESGTVTIDSSGRVTKAELCINDYTVTYDGKTATTGSKCGETEKEEEIVYADDAIYTKAKSLVYADGACKTDGTTYNYMGGCYIKGAPTNNYVWYNGFMWRIMGINSDNTVRLIVDENVTAIPYGTANTAESYATNEDYIHDWLNTYFLGHLNGTKSLIKEGNYFCSETIGAELTDDTVRDSCTSGKEVSAKVGLISYDEYYLSGLSSSYLNIGQSFWTMTPKSEQNVWLIYVDNDNNVNDRSVSNTFGIRPVINVDYTSNITSGDGTSKNYYVLYEDKLSNQIGKISSKATTGEYVSLEGKTYRVVSKDTNGVKLILDGYYDTDTAYGSDNTYSTTTGIGYILNNDVLTSLKLLNSNKILETTWYQGDSTNYGFKYIDVLNSKVNPVTSKVGLIRVGEMLSGQSSTILTNNYTTSSSNSNAKVYWTMNKYVNNTSVYRVHFNGNYGDDDVTLKYAIRPVIVVSNDLNISSGTGTWDNPYEI